SPAIAHDPDRSDRRQDREALPQAAIEVRGLDLVDDDPVRLAKRVQSLRGDLADDADREAGPRERLAEHHRLRQSELQANLTNLVLEQVAQRLDQLEAQVGWQPADVVMRLDLLRRLGLGGGAFDDVRIERALGQEIDPSERRCLLLEDPDELVADDLALLLRVLDTGEPGEEPATRVDHDEAHPEVFFEGLAEQLRFLLAHQT